MRSLDCKGPNRPRDNFREGPNLDKRAGGGTARRGGVTTLWGGGGWFSSLPGPPPQCRWPGPGSAKQKPTSGGNMRNPISQH